MKNESYYYRIQRKTLIVQEKQILRDLTDLANNKTVEELLVILEELGGN